jgi:hypothetical protein
MVIGNSHQREARSRVCLYVVHTRPARTKFCSASLKSFARYLTRRARASPEGPFGPRKDPTSRRASSLFSLYLQQMMDQFYRHHIRIFSLQDGRRRAAPAIGMTG